MEKRRFRLLRTLLPVLLFALFCQGCSTDQSSVQQTQSVPQASADHTYHPGSIQVLVPEAPGISVLGDDPLILDFSNVNQGYFTGELTRENTKVNIQVIGPDQITYKYFLSSANKCTVFPFTAGSGPYTIMAYENIVDKQYAFLFSQTIDLSLENEFLPFLYPNQYVWFTEENKAISIAQQISNRSRTDLEALTSVYQYVTTHISYDAEKAATVQNDYLPDIDETLQTGKGICFDYASLTAALLRSMSIPARLDIGYSGSVHHAWVDVYIESVGWVERAIEFNGSEWKLMDPTFASSAKDKKAIMTYIGDGSNYTLQYVR